MNPQLLADGVIYLKSIADGINNPWTIWVPSLGVFAALLLGIVGVMQDWIRGKILRPHLNPVELKKTTQSIPKKVIRIQIIENQGFIYHRLIVKNVGWFTAVAKNVRVSLTYEHPPAYFVPIPLAWTHFNDQARDIPPKEEVYVDIMRIKDGEYFYTFCWAPGTGSFGTVLDNYNPNIGNIRLEFYGETGKIGDIYLKFLEQKKELKIVKYINKWKKEVIL